MMRGVSESDDPSNFELIYQAQHGHVSQEMTVRHFPDSTSMINESRKVGEVFGALDAVGGDVNVILQGREARQSYVGGREIAYEALRSRN